MNLYTGFRDARAHNGPVVAATNNADPLQIMTSAGANVLQDTLQDNLLVSHPRGKKPLPIQKSLGPTASNNNRDEITPIAKYIVSEMNTNAHGADVKNMAEMNSFSAQACIVDFTKLPLWKQILHLGIDPEQCLQMELTYHGAALIAWAAKVKPHGDWDHKPKIATRFPSSSGELNWHRYGNTLYFYDIWSNLHYGYVGRAAGFSEKVLLDGAGAAQAISDASNKKWPKMSPTTSWLQSYDDPHDSAAIMLGVELYRRKPTLVTVTDVMNLVTHSNAISKKPYSP